MAGQDLEQSASAVQDTSSRSAAGAKLCVLCGKDLRGHTRMKDAEGRYWCVDCGKIDSQRKHPTPCPDCSREFPGYELKTIENVRVCPACFEKRSARLRREQSRLRAVQEEQAKTEWRKHLGRLSLITAIIVLAIYALSWLVVRA